MSGARRLAILAGGGGLPREIADSAAARGLPVSIVAIDGEADSDFGPHPVTVVNWGQIGAMVRALKAARATDLVIVGRVHRPELSGLKPDLGFFRYLPKLVRIVASGGDDSVLRRVVSFFERHGFRVLGAHDVAPELLAAAGVLGGSEPEDRLRRDIATGFALIEALAPVDVGQGVVIAEGRPVAIEGAEGTDRMLARLREMRAEGHGGRGGVIVKAPKRGQELRVDLPAVGPRTVEGAAAAGLAGIAVAAGQVLVAERERVRQLLTETGLFLVGADARTEAAPAGDRIGGISNQGRLRWISGKVRSRDIRDAERALGAISAVLPFGAGTAAVAVRQHVLAIEAGEGADRMLERVAGLRQWGDRTSRQRRGVAALRTTNSDPATCAQWAAKSGLAGIVLAGPWPEITRWDLTGAAARHGLFVLSCEDSG